MDGCGYSCWRPKWLQNFAKTRYYIAVYALLGTIQSASTTYFNITLTTMEKRFRFPSETTGIVLSGNEISQILLSLVLTYFGSQHNIPKWIAWGVVTSALSCFILAWPHFIYGAGEEAFKYTEEYLSGFNNISIEIITKPTDSNANDRKLCQNSTNEEYCDEEFSYVPLLLIFLSQFVLGIGNTLYYSLGTSYIDDNSKQHKSPLLMSYAYAMRMFGPTFGYAFAYVILRIYIDPSLTPVIAEEDPHWLGAWWLGWIMIGTLMFLFALVMGLFPRRIRKEIPIEANELDDEKYDQNPTNIEKMTMESKNNETLKEFPKAIWRILSNKLVVCNSFCTVFYLLSFTGTMTFIGRLMEVQFNKTSAGGSAFTGPLIMVGMSSGILLSGIIITKFQPRASYLFMWNIVVGFSAVLITMSYTQLGCENSNSMEVNGSIFACNTDCECDGISYTPVCDRSTTTTYFSPCHAGCKSFDEKLNIYTECDCPEESMSNMQFNRTVLPGACIGDCNSDFYIYSFTSMISSFLGLTGLMPSVLLSFRAVEPRDKALSQGFSLLVTSLFGFIPGPIIAGRIIDNACLIWNKKCGRIGNCLLYDPIKFRYYLHTSSAIFVLIAVLIQCVIWHYGRNLDLYSDINVTKKSKQIEKDISNTAESQPLK